MLLHFRSCFILSVFFIHFNLSRLGSTLKLAGQGAFVRWSHLCQFQDSSHMSILYTGRIWGSAWSQNIPGFQPAPVITGVLITISSPNGASAANFQNFSNSSIRLDAFVDSPSTTVKALAVAPRIALLSTLPILPVHKCSHILPVCCYMLLYVAMHMSHLPYTGHVGTRTRRRRICHLVMEMLDQNFQSFVCHILSHVSIDIHCVSDVFIDVLYISHYISILYYNNYWYY